MSEPSERSEIVPGDRASASESVGGRHEVVIVRHGATEWSRNGRHTSTTDLPLLPEGEDEARATAPQLAAWDFALVLVSPMVRAQETARLLGEGDRMVTDPDLREWAYGDYEGVTTPDIRRTNPGWTIWEGTTPNGEAADQVAARADRVIDRLRAADGPSLVVSHGHFSRVLMARWCGLSPVHGRHFAVETGTLNVLGHEHEYGTVRVLNRR